jgi:integrase
MAEDERELIAQLTLALAQSQAQQAQLATLFGEQAKTFSAITALAQVPSWTVRQIYERFEKAHRDHPSWVNIETRLRPFVAKFGDFKAMDVGPIQWASHRDERKTTKIKQGRGSKEGKCYSALTVNFELDWAKRMLNWAMEPEQGLLKANPLALARREKTRKKRATYITEADVQLALAAVEPKKPLDRLVGHAHFLLMVDQALRFQEALRLRRDRIRERHDGRVLADVGRTKNGETHFVALTERTWRALCEIPQAFAARHYFANPNRIGAPIYSDTHLRRLFRSMVECAGLDSRVADGDVRLRPHDMRRSAASAADRRGAQLTAIQDMMNHSSPNITRDYIERDEDSAAAIAQLMEDGAAKELSRVGPHRAPAQEPDVKSMSPNVVEKK